MSGLHIQKNDETLLRQHMDSIIDEFFNYAKELAEVSTIGTSAAVQIVKTPTNDRALAGIGQAP